MARGSASGQARRKAAKSAATKTAKTSSATRTSAARPKSNANARAVRKTVPASPRRREPAPPARGSSQRSAAASREANAPAPVVSIRPARPADLSQVIAIDSIVTGLEKAEYWRTIHRRYGDAERAGRRFLVAEADGRVAGFVIGEVRDWEFGSPPCGWVFAIDVHPQFRLAGLGTRLVAAMADWFRKEGVATMRTILARDNVLILSFFRSLGMTTGPFIPLEIDLERSAFFPIDRDSAA